MPRWETVKEYTFWGVIVFILVGPLMIGVFGPGLYYDYVKKQNPPGQPVKPDGTKNMYYAGLIFSYRLDDNKAKKIYKELIGWYEEPEREIPDDDPWVGMAVYQYANILWGQRRRQYAMQYLEIFVDMWGDNPKVDQRFLEEARTKMRIYRSGA